MKKTVEESRSLIYSNQLKWFEVYRSFIKGKVLVVGHGLGDTTEIISKVNPDVVGLDIELEKEAKLKEKVVIYDGLKVPFENSEFDVVILSYVLHHATNMPKLFEEVCRVSKSKVIILEETYKNLFQKLDLVYYDWYFNKKAGQNVTIQWWSYLTSERIEDLARTLGFKVELHKEEPMRSYKTELFVFSR